MTMGRRLLGYVTVTLGIIITFTSLIKKKLQQQHNVTIPPSHSHRKLRTKEEIEFQKMVAQDFQLAKSQSFGLFDNIRSDDWLRMKDRVKNRRNHLFLQRPEHNMIMPQRWYMFNFDPDFTCPHERRISVEGGSGLEGRWVCDPHRIADQVKRRKRQGGNGCLIYSIGVPPSGLFEFERGVQQTIGKEETCEIHVFDTVDYSRTAPRNVHFHQWSLMANINVGKTVGGRSALLPKKSLQQTLDLLGHKGATIDIFNVDCQGCEWNTFPDWMNADVQMNQILVEVHNAPSEAIPFFENLQKHGYVTFHKEMNTGNPIIAVNYAFLKLAKEFSE